MKAAAAAQPVDPTQDAEQIPGFFKILKKGDKSGSRSLPEQLKKPFFLHRQRGQERGREELGLVGMGDAQLAEFRVAGNQVQLVARNTNYFAAEGSPQAQFVSEDFADSLIASAPLVAGKSARW